jgi:hypothetical protein
MRRDTEPLAITSWLIMDRPLISTGGSYDSCVSGQELAGIYIVRRANILHDSSITIAAV